MRDERLVKSDTSLQIKERCKPLCVGLWNSMAFIILRSQCPWIHFTILAFFQSILWWLFDTWVTMPLLGSVFCMAHLCSAMRIFRFLFNSPVYTLRIAVGTEDLIHNLSSLVFRRRDLTLIMVRFRERPGGTPLVWLKGHYNMVC